MNNASFAGSGAGGGPVPLFHGGAVTTVASMHHLQEAIMSRMRPFGLTVHIRLLLLTKKISLI